MIRSSRLLALTLLATLTLSSSAAGIIIRHDRDEAR
jgi:hypothetical protein